MSYVLLTAFPDVPAGEVLFLDESNPDHPVYRTPNYPDFWADPSQVAERQDLFADEEKVYYFVDDKGDVVRGVDLETHVDTKRKEYGNFFKSEAEAVKLQGQFEAVAVAAQAQVDLVDGGGK